MEEGIYGYMWLMHCFCIVEIKQYYKPHSTKREEERNVDSKDTCTA